MKGGYRRTLTLAGLAGLGLALFVGVRMHRNEQKEAARLAEAEKVQISPTEAQRLDLGGFMETDFHRLPAPSPGEPAPSLGQWRALGEGLREAGLPFHLPSRCPVVSRSYGPVRYAVRPGAWRVLIDCRAGEGPGCDPVALSATGTTVAEGGGPSELIKVLATSEPVDYGKLNGHMGTEGMDRILKVGGISMLYNEFCSELGCNGSVAWSAGETAVKVEGGGDLAPWFTALARIGKDGG